VTPDPATRKPGMDHDWYAWSPLASRKKLTWPNHARIALCVVLNLEHYDFDLHPGSFTPASVPGGRGRGPAPDVSISSLREYGNRIGVFRIMRLLDRYKIPATIAIDATTASANPFLVRECKSRGWDFIGHGHSVTQTITSDMSAEQEHDHVLSAVQTTEKAVGQRIAGWLGPEYGESHRTPSVLSACGIEYQLDWTNDEQPYRMSDAAGRMLAIPSMLELDDVYAIWHRRITPWRWQRMVQEAFDRLYSDGAKSGRLLTLSLHPWLIGQAHRIKGLEDACAYMCAFDGVWMATAGQVAKEAASL
jgi:allantoinase